MVMSSPFHRLARAFAPYLRRWLCGLASGGTQEVARLSHPPARPGRRPNKVVRLEDVSLAHSLCGAHRKTRRRVNCAECIRTSARLA
jgi:hypothetical protein